MSSLQILSVTSSSNGSFDTWTSADADFPPKMPVIESVASRALNNLSSAVAATTDDAFQLLNWERVKQYFINKGVEIANISALGGDKFVKLFLGCDTIENYINDFIKNLSSLEPNGGLNKLGYNLYTLLHFNMKSDLESLGGRHLIRSFIQESLAAYVQHPVQHSSQASFYAPSRPPKSLAEIRSVKNPTSKPTVADNSSLYKHLIAYVVNSHISLQDKSKFQGLVEVAEGEMKTLRTLVRDTFSLDTSEAILRKFSELAIKWRELKENAKLYVKEGIKTNWVTVVDIGSWFGETESAGEEMRYFLEWLKEDSELQIQLLVKSIADGLEEIRESLAQDSVE
ncbi:MAG: hypothetical protein P4L16_01980 [Chlamydiales bacterium]|nr:hypothetical protein [Chlamydiales bacterium]